MAWSAFARVATSEAQEPSASIVVQLTLSVPPECGDRASFFDALGAQGLRVREASPGESATSLEVDLQPVESDFVGSVTVSDGDREGRRSVRGKDCRTVVQSLAFVAAIILDPSAIPDRAEPARPTVPPQGAVNPNASGPPTPARAAPPPPPSPGTATRFSAGVGLEAAIGLAPTWQLLPRVFVGLDLPGPLSFASVRLSAGRAFTTRVQTSTDSADLTLTEVRVEPCANIAGTIRAFALHACAVALMAILEGRGVATQDPRSETRAAIELGLGLRPTWNVSRSFYIAAMAAGAVPLTRYRFYFASPNRTIYRVDPWSLVGEISAGFYFW